jgi:hypothetical protein
VFHRHALLVSTSVPPTSKLKKFGAVAWGIGVLVFAMIFVGAIAGPKFIRFQTRSMQSEAKANLRELFVAERAFRDQHGTYTASAAANTNPSAAEPNPSARPEASLPEVTGQWVWAKRVRDASSKK